jgi:hypothetical protein
MQCWRPACRDHAANPSTPSARQLCLNKALRATTWHACGCSHMMLFLGAPQATRACCVNACAVNQQHCGCTRHRSQQQGASSAIAPQLHTTCPQLVPNTSSMLKADGYPRLLPTPTHAHTLLRVLSMDPIWPCGCKPLDPVTAISCNDMLLHAGIVLLQPAQVAKSTVQQAGQGWQQRKTCLAHKRGFAYGVCLTHCDMVCVSHNVSQQAQQATEDTVRYKHDDQRKTLATVNNCNGAASRQYTPRAATVKQLTRSPRGPE